MDKVIFFESEEHYEVLSAFVLSFLKYAEVQIEVYSNSKVKNYLFPLFEDCVTWKSLADEIAVDLKYQNTHFIITSPIENIKQIFAADIPYYYLVHNIHSAFDPLHNLFYKRPKSIFSYIKNYRKLSSNQKIIEHAKGLLFIDQNLTNYHENNYKENHPTQKTLTFPTYQNLQIGASAKKEKQQIVIPGNYHPSRRDFNPILKSLQTNTFPNQEFIFLGKLNSNLCNKVKSFKTNNSITYYEDELKMQEYYEIIQNGDLVILPLTKFKYFGGIKEIIGQSSYSAIWMDAFSSGIPALIPGYLEVEKEFSNFFFTYNDEKSLTDRIKEYFDQDYITLKSNFKIQIKQYFDPLIKNAIQKILND
jgi:hypothetical protein